MSSSSYSKSIPTDMTSTVPNSSGSVQISGPSMVPLQVSGPCSSVPIQLGQSNPIPIQLTAPMSDIGNLKLSRPSIQMQLSDTVQRNMGLPIYQIHLPGSANQNQISLEQNQMNNPNGNSLQFQLQDSNNSMQMKLPTTNPLQINNNPMQLQVSHSNGSHMTNQNSILQGTSKAIAPVVYIQTPSGLKPAMSSVAANISSFSLKRPVTTSTSVSSIQFLPNIPKNSTATKVITTSNSTLPSKMLPISLPASTGGKHAFTTYVSTVKKPISGAKIQDSNQSIIVPAPHLLIPSTTNQKIMVNPMNVTKINNPKAIPILPSSMTSKGPIINVQISNGQIQKIQHEKLGIMQQNTMLNSDVPPLQPLSAKNLVPISGSSVMPSVLQKITNSSDKNFSASIPTGSRVELIGEQEYALSIPETNNSKEDMFTMVLSHENENQNFADVIQSYEEKEKNPQSLLLGDSCKESENVPIRLVTKKSELDNVEKKIFHVSSDSNEDKSCVTAKNLSHTLSLICKNKVIEVSEENPLPSLFCSEKIETDTDGQFSRNKDLYDDITKSNSLQKIIRKPLLINKDRRKSRMSGENMVKHKEQFNKQTSDDNIQVAYEEDAVGLQWTNKIALLRGSNLQFKTNEFGMIDVLESDDEDYALKYNTPIKSKYETNGCEKKSNSQEDLYCCETCGCHGMAAEFVSPNFCSFTCERTSEKHRLKKLKDLEVKKKRKQKKILLQKSANVSKPKEEEEVIFNDIQKCNSKFLESYPEITITKMKNENKPQAPSPPKTKYPWINEQEVFSWYHWLEHCKAKPAPAKLFKESFNPLKNGFRVGMKMEAIDPVHPSLYAVVTVSEIQGFRMKLHFDGFHEDFDFWVNADSSDIFPSGWCEKNGRVLRPPVGFTQSSFSWPMYLKQVKSIAAPKHLFPHVSSTNICPNGFRIGMKLEAEDRKNSLTCVASVHDVVDNRILIHFDSWDDIYDYWVDPSSPYIHPVGWCDENGYSLTPPNSYKDPESFTWDNYLKDTNSTAVPPRAFKPRPPHNFKIGMKLEAVDKRVPFLIRCATVTDVRRHQLRISFDGWPDELSYWVDDDCVDIHEVGWCLKTGHPLEPPLTEEDYGIPGQCGTGGCRGLGNSFGARRPTHSTSAECPYKLPVTSPIIRDRLAAVRPPPLHAEPKNKEPRKILFINKDKNKDVSKMEIMVSDEDSNESKNKRKRKASPEDRKNPSGRMSKEPVQNVIYEPGYLPNPNWVSPPAWRINCLRVDEILQKQGLRMDPRNWSQTDVHEFIEKLIESREIPKQFIRHRIDGESLLMLSQDDLVNVFRMRLGPALKVYNSILQLREKILS